MESRLIWAENDTEIKTVFLKSVDLLRGWNRGAGFETDAGFWPKEVCSLFSNPKHIIAEIYAQWHFFAEEVATERHSRYIPEYLPDMETSKHRWIFWWERSVFQKRKIVCSCSYFWMLLINLDTFMRAGSKPYRVLF